eukprot:72108-Pleurochrysis_carterae.AAC.3
MAAQALALQTTEASAIKRGLQKGAKANIFSQLVPEAATSGGSSRRGVKGLPWRMRGESAKKSCSDRGLRAFRFDMDLGSSTTRFELTSCLRSSLPTMPVPPMTATESWRG